MIPAEGAFCRDFLPKGGAFHADPAMYRPVEGRQGSPLRSPEAADRCQALLDYMRVTSGETHFMARYPEECQATVEQETGFIEH